MTDQQNPGGVPVDVHWAMTDALEDPTVRAEHDGELDSLERVRMGAYMRDENKREFSLGRRLARQGLSVRARTLGLEVPRTSWKLVADAHGCLRVIAPRELAHLRFNISHGTGMVVCAVADGVDVGIDVEPLERRCEAAEIAHRFFSAREVEDLMALPDEQRQGRFLEYWTLKEAYIKARGLGLAIPLGGFSFKLHGAPALAGHRGRIAIEFAPEILDEPGRWHFSQLRLSPRHIVAVAVASGAAAPEMHISPAPEGSTPSVSADP